MTRKKIRRFVVSGFRGIRYPVTLDFSNRFNSLIVFGPNAKGKSSLADAVEWFFTGSIAELGKEGCGRTDYRHRLLDDSEDALVRLEVSDNTLSSDFVLPASLRQQHSNGSPEFVAYLQASKSELLILRHKDLKTFVDETKSNKRKHVAKLIGMEGWERIRDDMMAVENRLAAALQQQIERRNDRQQEAAQLVGTDEFSEETCWAFAERQAKVLGITYEIRDLATLRKADEQAKAISMASDRTAELTKLKRGEGVIKGFLDKPPQTRSFIQFVEAYNAFCSSPEKVLCHLLRKLYDQGKSILGSGQWSEDACPLCGLHIPRDELLAHIKQHEDRSRKIQEEIERLNNARINAKGDLKRIADAIRGINDLEADDIREIESLKSLGGQVALTLADARAVSEQEVRALAAIEIEDLKLSDKLSELYLEAGKALDAVRARQTALTPTAAERSRIEAFQNLSNLATHISALKAIELETEPLEQQVSSMRAFTAAFQELRRRTMGEVLESISRDVSRHFLALHPNEGFDDIQLKFLPEVDGVEFHIYYKGEEITPPRRFLSESYLSGLGVCLFLATVRAFNRENGFVVLDDIINSFDSEHRTDMARLLVNEFGDFQLIVLTHDELWFDFFRRLTGSGWQHKRIRTWSYENGINIEQAPTSELRECQEAIESGNFDYAAPKVRSYMENRLKWLSHKLGVRVRFRLGSLNDERMTGELISEMKRHLGAKGFFENADARSFSELEASAFVVNFGSHDRSTATVGIVMGDVQFALNRLLELEELFRCPECSKLIWDMVTQDFEMRCQCGSMHLD